MNLMKSAIKINKYYVIFKSNKIASKGKSQLLLYHYKAFLDMSELIKTEEEYSFIFSPLGQALITHKINDEERDIGNKILLFACKKYIKSPKNGISFYIRLIIYLKGRKLILIFIILIILNLIVFVLC